MWFVLVLHTEQKPAVMRQFAYNWGTQINNSWGTIGNDSAVL